MALAIRNIQFDGLDAVELLTSKARLVVVTSMGPRIAFFGAREGRNLLFWDVPRKYGRNDWKLMGGHRVWAMRPGAEESEESYAGDNSPCTVKSVSRGIEVRGAIHPVYRTRMSLVIKAMDDDTFRVENRITNVSEMVWSGGVWGLTCTLPKARTTYGVPLGRQGAWDIFLIGYTKRWAGKQAAPVIDPGIRLTEDCLVLKPHGRHTSKRIVQAPQGIMGMTDPGEGLSFLKHSAFEDGADYPYGCNIAFYAGKGNFMVEMESMGPYRSVLPGATLSAAETWMLREPVAWAKLKGVLEIDRGP